MRVYLFIFWMGIIVLSRLIPHWPNATPIISLSIFAGMYLSRMQGAVLILCSLILSDLALNYMEHYPIFGSWTFFTYTGFLFICLTSYSFRNSNLATLLASSCGYSACFWVWSNFGTWLATPLYPKSLMGLITCYIAALPFLPSMVLSALIWSSVFYLGIYYLKAHKISLS